MVVVKVPSLSKRTPFPRSNWAFTVWPTEYQIFITSSYMLARKGSEKGKGGERGKGGDKGTTAVQYEYLSSSPSSAMQQQDPNQNHGIQPAGTLPYRLGGVAF